MTPIHTKRPACAACLRPQRACICRWITRIEHSVEVLILQHPHEVGSAKGSARLLHLSLSGSSLAVGERFPEPALREALYAPRTPRAAGASSHKAHEAPRRAILLYPETPEAAARGMSKPTMIDTQALPQPQQVRLVVLDGTWRKSRKMLYANPLLQELPRLPLHNPPASRYLIRKAHGATQLSTLEATCYALMQLERNSEKFAPLLAAFDGFVAQQLAYTSAQDEVASAPAAREADKLKTGDPLLPP